MSFCSLPFVLIFYNANLTPKETVRGWGTTQGSIP